MPTVNDDAPTIPHGGRNNRRSPLQTTLYDLLRSVHDTLAPGEEDLAVPTVVHILRTHQVRWLGTRTDDTE